MKRKISVFLLAVFLCLGISSSAQDFNAADADGGGSNNDSPIDSTNKFKMGFQLGSVTIGGENYQQLGFRGEIPIGKLGLGLDLYLFMDAQGKIRKEDWDEASDYLDKLYYIRWANKGAPFYFKFGGMDYTYLGYSNIVNGYGNMIEYPTVRRWGLDLSAETENFGIEMLVNDFKEMFTDRPSVLAGGRVFYKVGGKLQIGVSGMQDFNQYNSLKDLDRDGYPDEIDEFDSNKDWVTKIDELTARGATPATIQNLVDIGELNSVTKDKLPKYGDSIAAQLVWGLDMGYPIINKENFKTDVYVAYSKINNYGWGASLPGFRMMIGKFFQFQAEYRIQSEEFLFGYFNPTYELERAVFATNPVTQEKYAITKAQSLKQIDKKMQGYFASATLNIGPVLKVTMAYQDLKNDESENARSIRGELGLAENLIPKLSVCKGYYIQNNVQDFQQWKTPQTIAGFQLGFELTENTVMGLDYRWTFEDVDGNGVINGNAETIKTIGIRTSFTF